MCSSELNVKRSLQNPFDFHSKTMIFNNDVNWRYILQSLVKYRAIRIDKAYEILKWQYMQTFTCKDVHQNVVYNSLNCHHPGTALRTDGTTQWIIADRWK